jgi:hypothetical protein
MNGCYGVVPLTTSLTFVRSATISSMYSGGRRASMVGGGYGVNYGGKKETGWTGLFSCHDST